MTRKAWQIHLALGLCRGGRLLVLASLVLTDRGASVARLTKGLGALVVAQLLMLILAGLAG